MSEIVSMLTSLKAAKDIAKAMIGIRDEMMIQSKVIELNEIIVSAQQNAISAHTAQIELIERERKLQKQLADMDAWEAEKNKYNLTQIRDGVFVYARKEEAQPIEPAHYICQNCFQNHCKSILQKETRNPGQVRTYVCHRCDAEVYENGIQSPFSIPPKAIRNRASNV